MIGSAAPPPEPVPSKSNWTCPLCEEGNGPFEPVCVRCGLTQSEAFDVTTAVVAEDYPNLLAINRKIADEMLEGTYFGG